MSTHAFSPGPSGPDAGPSPGASDAELIALACGGSRPSFGILVERHQPHVFALLRQRIRSAADAEDLAQDTFVRAWENLARFDQSRPFRTWVLTIASRLAIDHLRSRTAAARREAAVGRERPQPTGPSLPDELPTVWSTARDLLDDTPFTALWLRYVEGLDTIQIARVLGKNRVAVSMILCRARARLAAQLDVQTIAQTAAPARGGHTPKSVHSPELTTAKPAAARRAAAAAATPGVSS